MTAFRLWSAVAVAMAAWTGTASAGAGLPDQVIVKYKDNPPVASAAERVRALGARTGIGMRWLRSTATGAQVLQLALQASPEEINAVLRELKADGNVEYAEEDVHVFAKQAASPTSPSDARYPDQWSLSETSAGINVVEAWGRTLGEGAVVAIIDTGRQSHVDLGPNILNGYDFASFTGNNDGDGRDPDATDPGDFNRGPECPQSNSSWHGTAMNGVLAGVRNKIGISGIAPSSRVLAIRALGRCGGFISDIADGVIWAAGGQVGSIPVNTIKPSVINMSLGGTGTCGTTVQQALNFARSRNITLVAAAGNSASTTIDVPANCDGVISVGATGRTGARASYSSFGRGITLVAPGGSQTTSTLFNGILSTLNTGDTTRADDDYIYTQGSSMATVHVSGAVALMYSKNPTLTPDQVFNTLFQTARTPPGSCVGCGAGLLDAGRAVTAVPEPPAPVQVSLTANTTSVQVGQSATLSWQSANATSCTASGDWSGSKALTGQESVTSSSAGARSYTLTCSNAVSSSSSTVSVTFRKPDPARVRLTASTRKVEVGEPVTLRWQSENATSCTATGGWTGSKTLTGEESVTSQTAGAQTYTLTCRNASSSSSSSVSVSFTKPAPPETSCPTGFTKFNGNLAAGKSEFKTSASGFQGRAGREIFGIFRSENRSAVMRVQIQRQNRTLGLVSWQTVREHRAAGGPNAEIIPPSDGQYRFNVKMETLGGDYTLCLKR